jgi:hypothetical protein
VPKPRYKRTRTPDGNALADDVKEFADQFGDRAGSTDLGRFTIRTSETQVAHGRDFIPRWDYFDCDAAATVFRSRAPDGKYLYLIASAQVTCNVEVW